MINTEMEKHMRFLSMYSNAHQIIFRVSRSGITIEDVSDEAKKKFKESIKK